MSEKRLKELTAEIENIKIRLTIVENQLGRKSTRTKSSGSQSGKNTKPKIDPKVAIV